MSNPIHSPLTPPSTTFGPVPSDPRAENEAFYRAVLESMGEGLVVRDATGEIVAWNPSAERVLGMAPGTANATRIAELLRDAVREDGIPFSDEDRPHAVTLRTGQAQNDVMMGVTAADGRRIWIRASTRPLFRAGETTPYAMVGTFGDVTYRKQLDDARAHAAAALARSQELFRRMSEVTPDVLYLHDLAENRNVFVNREVSRTLGYSPEEFAAMGDALLRTIVHPDDLAGVTAHFAALRAAADGDVLHDEHRVIHRDGSVRWLSTRHVVFSREDDGVPRVALGVATDVTDRKAWEDSLRAAREQAEAANRAKSDFLARMSHELRTPLNSVIGFATILGKRAAPRLGDVERTYIERIRSNGVHLLGLINDILDLAKIEAGRVVVELHRVEVTEIVRDVAALFEPEAATRGLELRLALPESSAFLETDGSRLRQVLLNLVANALKFTERGSVTISLTLYPGTTELAEIAVADTGIGIPPERQLAVFQPFEQAEESTSRRFGGTGLGLAISKQLVELLGGTLSLYSVVGHGTTFRVRFPR